MPDDDDLEKKLEKLGEAYRRGVQKTEPLSEEDLSTVRRAIREKWEEEEKEGQTRRQSSEESKAKERTQEEEKEQAEKREKRKGHSH